MIFFLQMFAVDCEMCRTAVGLELTRISIVDEAMQPIYEKVISLSSCVDRCEILYLRVLSIMNRVHHRENDYCSLSGK